MEKDDIGSIIVGFIILVLVLVQLSSFIYYLFKW